MKLSRPPLNLRRLGERLPAGAQAWGWPGLLGLVCLLAAAALALGWLPSLLQQAQQLSDAADAAELRATRLSKRPSDGAASLSAPERFRGGFPPAQTRQARVGALLALATAQGLPLTRGEFQLEALPELGLQRYRLTLPLSGSYEQIRQFIQDAQDGDAALSLDRLHLRRASAEAPLVEADLGWSLYMQAAASGRAAVTAATTITAVTTVSAQHRP